MSRSEYVSDATRTVAARFSETTDCGPCGPVAALATVAVATSESVVARAIHAFAIQDLLTMPPFVVQTQRLCRVLEEKPTSLLEGCQQYIGMLHTGIDLEACSLRRSTRDYRIGSRCVFGSSRHGRHKLAADRIGAYVALTPSESSSGALRALGGIAKTSTATPGGCCLKRPGITGPLTVPPRRSCAPGGDRASAAARVRGHASNQRLHDRWGGFQARRRHSVIARELAGWCWSLAVMTCPGPCFRSSTVVTAASGRLATCPMSNSSGWLRSFSGLA